MTDTIPTNPPETLEEAIARYHRIIDLREEGKTYEEVGMMFRPHLSKQRIQTIIARGEPVRMGGRPKTRT